MKYIYINIFFVFISSLFSYQVNNDNLLSNGSYITGQDGIIRMYVNVIGDVKKPGTYLVYDDIDILSVISLAGGFLNGSKTNSIILHRKDGSKTTINLDSYLKSLNDDNIEKINFLPHDTILIEQKAISNILTSTNLPYIVLGILNVVLTLQNNSD